METEKLFEITAYTENQVGLLSAIAGIFTRRSLNIEKLLVYPSQIAGIHKFKILTRAAESQIQTIVLQIEKKVDVIKSYYEVDNERSCREIDDVRQFLQEREKESNNSNN